MKLLAKLLIPVFIGAATTTTAADATVYIIEGQDGPSTTSNPPALNPEEAALVFAQRLGVSQYHGIGNAKDETLVHINTFGGRRESIFQDSGRDKAAELILLVQGVSSDKAGHLINAWSSLTPAFTISDAPSAKANLILIEDLQQQVGPVQDCAFEDAINPFNDRCWNGRSKAMFTLSDKVGIKDLLAAQERLIAFAKDNEMNTMVILMPDSNPTGSLRPYGSYEIPSQTPLRRRQAEEPMTDAPVASSPAFKSKQVMTSNTSEPITGVPAVCYSTLDACTSSTNNCSGHGECYKKSGSAKGAEASPSCYACACVPTKDHFLEGASGRPAYREIYWGGAACQKKDVSGPFWLFAIFTVVLIGLVSWAIGLLFSIGEEKLPGVIGAGVSASKTR